MSNKSNSRLLFQNRLLSTLPVGEFDFLKPHLEAVSFSTGDIIYQTGDAIRHVYFPLHGMVSLLSVTEQGNAVEIGYVGNEGLVGLPIVLGQNEMPYQAMVQVPAQCFRVESKIIINLFERSDVFRSGALKYVYLVIKQISQTCICNHFHTIEARLCRWLAVMCDYSDENILLLTQEFFAHILGVQRTSVGMVANALQSRGIIRYSRGKIEVIDLKALKGNVCECYHIVKSEYDKFLIRQ